MSDKLDYKVVRFSDLDGFVKEVNKLTNDGWKPLGGISTNTGGGPMPNQAVTHYTQALTRKIRRKPLDPKDAVSII